MIRKSTSERWTISLLAALTLCGSAIAMSLAVLIKVPPTPISVLFRLIIVILSIFIIVKGLIKVKFINLSGVMLLSFWLIYSYHVITDIYIYNITWGKSNSLILGFVFGNCLLPILAVLFSSNRIDLKKVVSTFYYVLGFTGILLFQVIYINKGGQIDPSLFEGRQSYGFEVEEGIVQNIINPILISKIGGVVAIVNLCQILYVFQGEKMRFASLAGVGLGFVLLMVGASRGPLISFGLSFLLFLFYLFIRLIFKRGYLINKISTSGILLLTSVITFLFIAFSGLKFSVLWRIKQFFNGSEFSENNKRIQLIESALQEFYSSPIFGHHYICIAESWNPHNLYVEVLMATGVFGAFFFFSLFIFLCRDLVYTIMKDKPYMFTLQLILIYLLIGQITSGSIINPLYWTIFALVLCVPKKMYQ